MLPEAAQGASRLIEALEKLSQWAGNEAGGHSPSGMPSHEAVQAFEYALNGPSEGGSAVSASGITADAPSDSLSGISADTVKMGGEPSSWAGPADVMPSLVPDGTVPGNAEVAQPSAADRVDMRLEDKDDALLQELGQLMQDISQPGVPVGPEILFRAQYLAGMLKVQGQTGVNSSQQLSQGMENILRQQG